jgi:hypothetical protein
VTSGERSPLSHHITPRLQRVVGNSTCPPTSIALTSHWARARITARCVVLFGVPGMADTRLTKVGPLQALQLCAFGALCPRRLIEAERRDEEVRKGFSQPPPPEEPRAFKLRRGVWGSLVWVLFAIVVGYIGGRLLGSVAGQTTGLLTRVLQFSGATILLWATLFVRGWDIQSIGGVTLTERVNRWIYRLLYCLGTAAIVASLVLP